MSTTVPPPMRPPNSGATFDLNLDDLKDKFWAAALEVLEVNSALLSYDCEGPLRSYISDGARRFLEASFEKQNLSTAVQNLRELIREMVSEAASRRMLAASAGGAQPMLIIEEEDFRLILQRSMRWRFWPFS
jgi:hypothetical protein